MDEDTIDFLKIKGALSDVPIEEYTHAKDADGAGVELHEDSEGRQSISKNSIGCVEKALKIKEEEAATAASERGISFPEGSIDRVVTIFGSDNRVDRHGDIVMQDWDLKEFGDNPVTLFGHDWIAPPIGASLREKVMNRKVSVDNKKAAKEEKLRALKMDLFFPNEDVTKFGDEIFRLIDAGLLRTFSVGFMPGKVTRVEDDKERERLGLGKFGFILSNNKLMEISATPIPANVGAHVLMCSAEKGIIDGSEIQTLRELYRGHYGKSQDESGFVRNDCGLLEMWQRMFPNVEVSQKRDFTGVFDPSAYEVKKRVAPKDDAPDDDAAKLVGTDKEAIDNDLPESKDSDIKAIVEQALQPVMDELRTQKDNLEGLQSTLDDLSEKQIETLPPESKDTERNLGSTLAAILSEE